VNFVSKQGRSRAYLQYLTKHKDMHSWTLLPALPKVNANFPGTYDFQFPVHKKGFEVEKIGKEPVREREEKKSRAMCEISSHSSLRFRLRMREQKPGRHQNGRICPPHRESHYRESHYRACQEHKSHSSVLVKIKLKQITTPSFNHGVIIP
jgi:hypothetical protein